MFPKQFFLLATLCHIVFSEDADCTVEGIKGKCMSLMKCPSAIQDLKLKITPKICFFNGTSLVPIVCCANPAVKTVKLSTASNGGCQGNERYQSYKPKEKQLSQGHKAWAKCVEYQDKAVFPCMDPVALVPTVQKRGVTMDRCFLHNRPTHVIIGGGGIDADVGEFPHMALLGYGNETESAEWLCGGSLISERFILTAAHCLNPALFGPLTFAALGVYERSESKDLWNIYKIERSIRHPDFHPPSKYHDIALLQTDKEIKFGTDIIPACLHVGDQVPDSRVSATGWGVLGPHTDLADTLQNIPLWKVPDVNCSEYYGVHRHLAHGFDSATQVCYGDDGRIRDTCKGDSGGPLNVISQDIYCMYLIFGVTSFGFSRCNQIGYPGIYTKVSHYVPWIESVVWP